MLKKKVFISIVLIVIFAIISISNICYATWVPVTPEKIIEAYEDYLLDGATVKIVGDKFVFSQEGQEDIEIKYDLSEEPTFWIEIPINNTITYEEYQILFSKCLLPLTLHVGVLGIQGVEKDDTTEILYEPMLQMIGELGESLEEMDEEEDFSAEKAFEFVKSTWGEKTTTKDKNNTMKWTVETKEVTDRSCVVVSTVVTNKDADFSKFKSNPEEVINEITNVVSNVVNEEETNTDNENTTVENKTVPASNTNKTTGKLPNSGDANKNIVTMLYVVIVISSISILFFTINLKKKN